MRTKNAPPWVMWLRLLSFGAVVGVYLVSGAFLGVVVRNPIRRRRLQAWGIAFAARATLRILDIHLRVHGLEQVADRSKPIFLVCNHTGFMDVVMVSSFWTSNFVTSVEVQTSGLLGLITKLGGCLFVERRNRSRLQEEKQEIAQVISRGLPVFVFPEGTSSNGDGVLPFKAALFDCAIYAKVPVQPVVVCYSQINGVKPDRELQDHAYYYGDMSFFPQLKRMFSLRAVIVDVVLLPQIPTDGLEADGTGRKELANLSHARISETYASLKKQHHAP